MRLHYKGFTLLEIMVTIAIVAVLTTIGVVATQSVRSKARDANRVSDVQQVVGALEQYYTRNGSYPTMITAGQSIRSGSQAYLKEVPQNPFPRTDGDCLDKDFHYETTATGYQLTFCLGSDSGSLKKGVNVCINGNCKPGTTVKVKDSDGNEYGTVAIGGQLWLDKNLSTETYEDGTCINGGGGVPCPSASAGDVERSCYNNNEANCDQYGALYSWLGVFNTLVEDPQEGARGICPVGWHIPTDSEWHSLESYLSSNPAACNAGRETAFGCTPAGTKLKQGGTSGFNGLLGGYRVPASSSYDLDSKAYFWTSSDLRLSRNLDNGQSGVERAHNLEEVGFSVRCIKNN